MSETISNVMMIAAGGARSIVMGSNDPVLPTFIVVDTDERYTIVGWGIDEQPQDDVDTLIGLLRTHDAIAAAFIAEAVAVATSDDSDEMLIVDSVVVIAADRGETSVRTFVVNRALPLTDDDRFVEFLNAGGSLNYTWLEHALEEARP